MVDSETFRQLSLSFPRTVEQPHFNATSFRINGKIFASLEIDKAKACLKFSPENQEIFCSFDKAIYPVKKHWGKSGWTYTDIKNMRKEVLSDIKAGSSSFHNGLTIHGTGANNELQNPLIYKA